jgi:hypothetical protein
MGNETQTSCNVFVVTVDQCGNRTVGRDLGPLTRLDGGRKASLKQTSDGAIDTTSP